jgi:hypothetical protein
MRKHVSIVTPIDLFSAHFQRLEIDSLQNVTATNLVTLPWNFARQVEANAYDKIQGSLYIKFYGNNWPVVSSQDGSPQNYLFPFLYFTLAGLFYNDKLDTLFAFGLDSQYNVILASYTFNRFLPEVTAPSGSAEIPVYIGMNTEQDHVYIRT